MGERILRQRVPLRWRAHVKLSPLACAGVWAAAALAGGALGAALGEPLLARLAPAQARIAELCVSGNRRVPSAELAALANVAPGALLPHVDTAEVRAALLAHPWVREARVAALPPSRLIVAVEERTPVAIAVFANGERLWVDRDGVAFTAAPADAHATLLIGVDAAPPHAADPRLADGVALLAAAERHALAPQAVQLGGAPPEALPVLRFPRAGAPELLATVGPGEYDAKLARLARVLAAASPEASAARDAASEIDLRFGEHVVLRRSEETAHDTTDTECGGDPGAPVAASMGGGEAHGQEG
jgi:hypothetical protein